MERGAWKVALIGVAAGLAASYAMELAQSGIAKLIQGDDKGSEGSEESEPATAKAARAGAGVAAEGLSDQQAQSSGPLVH
jgi:hypothetical protein